MNIRKKSIDNWYNIEIYKPKIKTGSPNFTRSQECRNCLDDEEENSKQGRKYWVENLESIEKATLDGLVDVLLDYLIAIEFINKE